MRCYSLSLCCVLEYCWRSRTVGQSEVGWRIKVAGCWKLGFTLANGTEAGWFAAPTKVLDAIFAILSPSTFNEIVQQYINIFFLKHWAFWQVSIWSFVKFECLAVTFECTLLSRTKIHRLSAQWNRDWFFHLCSLNTFSVFTLTQLNRCRSMLLLVCTSMIVQMVTLLWECFHFGIPVELRPLSYCLRLRRTSFQKVLSNNP